MCLAVYIASDHVLPLIPWDEANPSFYVNELSYEAMEVRMQFTLPNVRYLGSDAGCGCGFLKGGVAGKELIEAQENYSKLASYISDLHKRGALIQVFSCWAGDEIAGRDFSEEIDINDLLDKDFEFMKKAFYELR
jgi:hypothetical protein